MLNKHCRRFLKFLRKTSPDFNKRVYTKELLDTFPEPYESTLRMIRYLETSGYVEFATLNEEKFGIVLTEKGMNYRQFQAESVKLFLIKSILTPITVSILTTLLTLWLKALL